MHRDINFIYFLSFIKHQTSVAAGVSAVAATTAASLVTAMLAMVTVTTTGSVRASSSVETTTAGILSSKFH